MAHAPRRILSRHTTNAHLRGSFGTIFGRRCTCLSPMSPHSTSSVASAAQPSAPASPCPTPRPGLTPETPPSIASLIPLSITPAPSGASPRASLSRDALNPRVDVAMHCPWPPSTVGRPHPLGDRQLAGVHVPLLTSPLKLPVTPSLAKISKRSDVSVSRVSLLFALCSGLLSAEGPSPSHAFAEEGDVWRGEYRRPSVGAESGVRGVRAFPRLLPGSGEPEFSPGSLPDPGRLEG